MTGDEEELDWTEGGPLEDRDGIDVESADGDSRPVVNPNRGEVFTKQKLAHIIGCALPTMDKYIREGLPVVRRAVRTLAYQINSAQAIDWIRKRDVTMAGGKGESISFDAVRKRDKQAQARLRELEIAKREGELIDVDAVVDFIGKTLATVRSRFLAVEGQVMGLTDEQRAQLKAAIFDALTDVSGDKRSDWIGEDDFDSDTDTAEEPSEA